MEKRVSLSELMADNNYSELEKTPLDVVSYEELAQFLTDACIVKDVRSLRIVIEGLEFCAGHSALYKLLHSFMHAPNEKGFEHLNKDEIFWGLFISVLFRNYKLANYFAGINTDFDVALDGIMTIICSDKKANEVAKTFISRVIDIEEGCSPGLKMSLKTYADMAETKNPELHFMLSSLINIQFY